MKGYESSVENDGPEPVYMEKLGKRCQWRGKKIPDHCVGVNTERGCDLGIFSENCRFRKVVKSWGIREDGCQ